MLHKFSPYNGVYITYRIVDIKYMPNDRFISTAVCVVQADRKLANGTFVRSTFDDINREGANTLPPTDWDLNIINGSLYQLQGIRLSSTVIEALMWATEMIGVFDRSKNVPFLDTIVHLNIEFTWVLSSQSFG